MEPAKETMRIIVNLGKYQVSHIEKGVLGVSFTLSLPNNVKVKADLPVQGVDIRVGDYLTLYTEVLTYAVPSTPSIQ